MLTQRIMGSIWVVMAIVICYHLIQNPATRWDLALLGIVSILCGTALAVLLAFGDALIGLGENALRRDAEQTSPRPGPP